MSRGEGREVLFLAQLPPPLHGQSVMAKAVRDVMADHEGCRITQMWGGGADGNGDVGRRSLRKYLGFGLLLSRLTWLVLSGKRFDLAYLGLAPWAHTALRDTLLAWFARRISRRVLVHVHGDGLAALLTPGSAKSRLARRLLSGTELIAVTGLTAREARGSGIFASVLELPNLAADPGPPLRHQRDELVVSCLCNLDPRKGVFDFVDAVAAAVARGVRLRAVIAGAGTAALSEQALRDHIASRGLDHAITVAGRVDETARAQLLTDSDVFLYLSRHDLAPLVLIEAMAHGCAPLVLDIGGLREMAGARLAGSVLDASLADARLASVVADRLAAYAEGRAALEDDRAAARARYLENYSPGLFGARLRSVIDVEAQQPMSGTRPEDGRQPAGRPGDPVERAGNL